MSMFGILILFGKTFWDKIILPGKLQMESNPFMVNQKIKSNIEEYNPTFVLAVSCLHEDPSILCFRKIKKNHQISNNNLLM